MTSVRQTGFLSPSQHVELSKIRSTSQNNRGFEIYPAVCCRVSLCSRLLCRISFTTRSLHSDEIYGKVRSLSLRNFSLFISTRIRMASPRVAEQFALCKCFPKTVARFRNPRIQDATGSAPWVSFWKYILLSSLPEMDFMLSVYFPHLLVF